MQLALHGWLQVDSSVPQNTQQLVMHTLRPSWVTAMLLRAAQWRAAPDAAVRRLPQAARRVPQHRGLPWL